MQSWSLEQSLGEVDSEVPEGVSVAIFADSPGGRGRASNSISESIKGSCAFPYLSLGVALERNFTTILPRGRFYLRANSLTFS